MQSNKKKVRLDVVIEIEYMKHKNTYFTFHENDLDLTIVLRIYLITVFVQFQHNLRKWEMQRDFFRETGYF